MSVLIKGMKMPQKCFDCKLCAFIPIGDDGLMTKCLPLNRATDVEKLRPDCPLVSVPDHGDLVDRDEFIGRLQSWALLIAAGHGDDDEWVKCIGEVCDHLYDAPVVIPAERSE